MDASARKSVKERTAFGTVFFLSAFGYEVLFFVMTLKVYTVTQKAINVGVFTAITFVPKLLSPACGALVDRFGTKPVIAASAAATAILAMLLPLLDSLWAIYALWLPLSALFILLGNARTVLMTQVSSAGGYVGGNALAFSLLNAARLAAPLCAGFLSGSMSPFAVTAISACGYGMCAAGALILPSKGYGRSALGAPKGGRAALWRTLGEGFTRIRAPGRLRLLVGVSAIRNLFLGFMPSLLVVIVAGRFGGTDAEYGIAMTAAALCSLAGGLIGPVLAKYLPHRYLAGLGLGAHFACFAALGLASSFASAVAAMAAGSFALYAAAVVLHAGRDAATEPSVRGRVYGANTALQTLASLASMILGSALADRFNAGPVFLASGATAVVSLALVSAFVAVSRTRRTG